MSLIGSLRRGTAAVTTQHDSLFNLSQFLQIDAFDPLL
jgi:hypothetical protein